MGMRTGADNEGGKYGELEVNDTEGRDGRLIYRKIERN